MIDLWTIICECCIVLSAWLEFRPETVSDTVRSRSTSLYEITLVIWLGVLPHGMDGCSPQNYYLFFSVSFLGLVIFQSPLFPDEVGPYAEFQRSLINWFTPWVWDCFSSSLIFHMWYYSAYLGCATVIWADVSRCKIRSVISFYYFFFTHTLVVCPFI